MTHTFPFISVSGAPYERGLAYGRAAADRVRLSAQNYLGALSAIGFPDAQREALIAAVSGEIEAFGAHYLDEMRGIAEGAGVTLQDIIMINARTEVLARARAIMKVAAPAQEPEDGCTGAIILPERSQNGRLLHGQNWDWRAASADTSVVLRIARDDGPDILTFVEAGGLARSGLNSAGIAITANYLECERDYTGSGVPLSLLRRKVLEQSDFALAFQAVMRMPKICSNNIMISTAEGFGVDIECAPDEGFHILPEDGLLVHSNHWVSPTARAKLRDTGIANTPDSIYRDWRVRQLLSAGNRMLTLDDMRAAFFDDFAYPYSVCRPPRLTDRGDISTTVAMVLMEPAAGFLEVARIPAEDRRFTRYSLTEDPVDLPAPAAAPARIPA